MRLEYQYKAEAVISLGHDKKVYSERIDPGWILEVKCCYFYVPEISTNDKVILFIEGGSQELIVRARGKEVGRLGMSALCPFLVGEHQRVVGSAPNADVGDTLELTVIGEITPLFSWRGWY